MERSDYRSRPMAPSAVPLWKIIGVILLLGIVVPGARADDEHGCTLATLNGAYAVTTTGNLKGATADTDFAVVGVTTYDGEGNTLLRATSSFGGTISSFVLPGTYTVNFDCTGTQMTSISHGAIVILDGGNEIMFILASSTVKDLVAGSGIRFGDRGTPRAQGIPGEWRLFAVADAI